MLFLMALLLKAVVYSAGWAFTIGECSVYGLDTVYLVFWVSSLCKRAHWVDKYQFRGRYKSFPAITHCWCAIWILKDFLHSTSSWPAKGLCCAVGMPLGTLSPAVWVFKLVNSMVSDQSSIGVRLLWDWAGEFVVSYLSSCAYWVNASWYTKVQGYISASFQPPSFGVIPILAKGRGRGGAVLNLASDVIILWCIFDRVLS